MATPLLITAAPNGARRGKRDHPAIPLTPAEIAHEAAACAEAGAGMLHLHVRDGSGAHSLDADHYRAAIGAVRATCGDRLTIQMTTEACGVYDRDAQVAAVRAVRPEAASFAIREFFGDGREDERPMADFFAWVARAGIAAQFILYAAEEVDRLRDLVARGVLPFDAPHALFVLGRHAADGQSDPADLVPFLARWPQAQPWSVCAFGIAEARAAAAAAAFGGHARVGFENNLAAPDGRPLASTAEQVARVAAVAAALGRPLARSSKEIA